MPSTTDASLIRAVLETDRPWAAYALGDLEPGFFEHCRWWYRAEPVPTVVLFYEAFAVPILLAVGPAEGIALLLDEAPPPPRMYLHVRTDILPLVRRRHLVEEPKTMHRMTLDPATFRPATSDSFVRLSPSDAQALDALYRDREAAGEAPGFYTPSMLSDGTYFGCFERGALVSVAGTHLVAPHEGVAAIGNVYTRLDRRGLGLGAAATSAVAAELLARGTRTVVLSVDERNATAIRIYERLGFRFHCAFIEGVAVARQG